MRIDKTRPNAKLSRDNYLNVSIYESFTPYAYAEYKINLGMVSNLVLDPENKKVLYTDSYYQFLRENAMLNFDINMTSFAHLDEEEFVCTLNDYIKKYHFVEITDLNCEKFGDPYERKIEGYIYIMVLAQYKQVYIGMTRSALKKRITSHWRSKKSLDRLVFGCVETSKISIDSFGALDTTQIYAKPYRGKKTFGLEELESRYIYRFDHRFLLNRLA